MFDPIAQLEKFLAVLEQQRRDVLKQAAGPPTSQVDERVRALMEQIDRVKEQLEGVRPRAEGLKQQLEAIAERRAAGTPAPRTPLPPPPLPENWPLKPEAIQAAVRGLIQRAHVAPPKPAAPAQPLGEVQEMSSDAWNVGDRTPGEARDRPPRSQPRVPDPSDVRDISSGAWEADDDSE